ncbi:MULTISPECIES: cell wall-binding protein EntB [Bacillus cereus group]|uniref:cell wall-binding protein EntB n=1 Tax=Bacillus cereus group TaxID=86661 RepID=UPI0029C4747C|nr:MULTISPECIES: cell wall-binding protein EntB [unclassified Bacillus cereus group]MDX5744935.1 cell wall-binding protein EntB [Bacillus cereus group sp. BfR-BA-02570]MDX5813876.1 cell wall-binding protein EntB [Bacillus cereus group sp. BfR-BA-01665]MDX5819591.1 cell wall-binding protein EntB [Bacillus cereus group sp. BfR-BA-02490]MDX5830321.1 cell wall-binding protein EntB [Bacillus cereus group sp. BfR-BA-01748]MDX5841892.1 cell wall-binding protein EntB [Bacillus cereus group sp. BfR-BA-
MKKVIGAATATVFGLGAFTTTATAETIVTADVLNVREKPTTESKVVEKVKNGEELKVINTEDGWSKIELNGKEVFVSSEFTKDIYHVTADLLNVRSESNTESKILGRLKKDDVIESTKQVKDGWLQFEYKGKTAYVNVSFLSSKAPIEKKADEKTKQVAKVQKSVKAKEEAKTQKITKAKETIKPKEEVKVQEVAKPKEEVKVQEVAKPKEEVKVQEVAKPKEEVKVQEEAKAKEEAKVQEIAKAKEEVKVQEIAKAKEEAKAQEIAKAKEEVKAQEIAKAKEEAKAREIAKAKEEAKAREIAKAKEEAKAQEIAKAKEEAKAREIAKAKEEAKAREIAKAKEEAKAREIAKAKEEAKAREALKAKEESKNNAQSAKRELTVVATAYTADPSENGTYGGRVLTAMGHDLTANPNMRIIAVDPKVIPLGSKVWVEGYGEAIAGDTGSAIKGNRIDVLMGSKSKAMNWGRQTVKVKIL